MHRDVLSINSAMTKPSNVQVIFTYYTFFYLLVYLLLSWKSESLIQFYVPTYSDVSIDIFSSSFHDVEHGIIGL